MLDLSPPRTPQWGFPMYQECMEPRFKKQMFSIFLPWSNIKQNITWPISYIRFSALPPKLSLRCEMAQ